MKWNCLTMTWEERRGESGEGRTVEGKRDNLRREYS